MDLIKKDKLGQSVKNIYDYSFEISEKGLYLIEIVGSAKSWWQNTASFKSFFQDDDLAVKIDGIEFPKLNGKAGIFDSEVAWNGNNLKGLSKTNLFIINLDGGNHALNFLADKNPTIESIAIFKINEEGINYIPLENNPAQDGNRRQWMAIIPMNLSVKSINIKAGAKNYQGNKDDDDIKLIINGNIQKNESDKYHKNWFWCGKILNGQSKEFNRELNLEKGLLYIELWADRMPVLENIKITVDREPEENKYKNRDLAWWENRKEIKGYIHKGVLNDEDYNHYDDLIKKAVARWNEEFFSDIYPPDEPLDPNLVKAIIFQESRVGYDKKNNGDINVMQVGNYGDLSLEVLNGKSEKTEYELKNGNLWAVDYGGEANVENIYNSIYWGVRWLYHRAQWIGDNGEKHWFSWKDAVKRYGPGTQKYIDNIWNIYLQGVDIRNDPPIKLWVIALLIFISIPFFSFSSSFNRSMKSAVFDTINPRDRAYTKNIEIKRYSSNSSLFLAIIEREKDWSEDFKAGAYKDGKVEWLQAEDMPTEQAILKAKFVSLKNFKNPIIEVYGETHTGHGAMYLYAVRDDQLELLLKTPAVDFNNDIRWSPDNYEKYGYGNCGEVFAGGRLASSYRDLNNDNVSDIVLSGTEEIICEKELKESFEKYAEVKVASIPVKKVFLWDKNKNSYSVQ